MAQCWSNVCQNQNPKLQLHYFVQTDWLKAANSLSGGNIDQSSSLYFKQELARDQDLWPHFSMVVRVYAIHTSKIRQKGFLLVL
ncbi:hypothetical protein GDO86_008090 [Hymenochirus boettgeri]|uniref:Uncharacterized protein n=1 Tax=Hymenochirus boettgeri TaxID=247094 RepID=A0A8T2IZ44_9PIPI|nr:hypothetical protein GDO86_008090 [Hymenochirus boettgeri]